jgi:antitoxin component YwqK of YwqJK toxin-antitoxin module
MRLFYSFIAFLFVSVPLFPQTDTVFNHTDTQQLKQGYWKKNYSNGKLMYTGFFKDNKPLGEMRRYYESGALKAILNYRDGSHAKARLYYENGEIAAEGNYIGAQKDSVWTYFSYYNKSITGRESFDRGKKHGLAINYYGNGDVSEKTEWFQDKKSGLWEQYFNNNVPKLKARYKENKLHGQFIVYYNNGEPYISGNYENDLREGKWTLFNEDGTVQAIVNYSAGKAAEEEKLNEDQQKFFQLIDEAQGKFNEPDETDFLEPGR